MQHIWNKSTKQTSCVSFPLEGCISITAPRDQRGFVLWGVRVARRAWHQNTGQRGHSLLTAHSCAHRMGRLLCEDTAVSRGEMGRFDNRTHAHTHTSTDGRGADYALARCELNLRSAKLVDNWTSRGNSRFF